MRLSCHTLYEAEDELDGLWSRERLIEMNARFTERLEEAFRLGLESRESAAGQVKLPGSLGPRWVTPLTREIQEGLLRSNAAECPRVYCPLGNRDTIVVQGASDATLTTRSNQLVLPAQPILIIDLTFPAHRRHL